MDYIKHPWINDNIIEKRAYQEAIIMTALKDNTLCVIPTGLGKTNIAAIVAASRLQKSTSSKVLLMAPTKPLVEQHYATFKKFFKLGPELRVVTGGNDPDIRASIYKEATIVFSTPQTIANDLKKGRLTLNDFSLVIFDEAHRAVGNYAYPYVAKVYMSQSKDPLILGLTASPGGQRYKIEEVCGKLFIKNVEIRSRDDDDVRQYVQDVSYEWEEVELTDEQKMLKRLLEAIKEDRLKTLIKWGMVKSTLISKSQMLELQTRLARRKSGIVFSAMSKLAEAIKIDHALLLLETQCIYSLKNYFDSLPEKKSKAVERLMKDEKFVRAIHMTSEMAAAGREHPKLEKLCEIVGEEIKKDRYTSIIIFAQFRDTIKKIKETLSQVPYAAPVEFIGQAKKKGRGLSQKEQMQILGEFKMGFSNILIASQVGEEGLDIEETNTVIFYEPVPSAIRRVQRAGRTARTHSGKVIVLITKNTRDEAYHWSAHQKEKKMKKILYDMQSQPSLNNFENNAEK